MLCLAAAWVIGLQEPQTGLQKHTTKVMTVGATPVTQSEAREVFSRAEGVLRESLSMRPSAAAVSIGVGSSPVRRDQVVGEMVRIYNVVRPKVKLTPAPTAYDASVLRIAASQKANLNMLVRMGAVARVGPLAVGPGNSLTVPQFGDAVGFFLARMAELTHMPSNKWTPVLENPNGG